ncbi:MAG: 3-methyl-2-oxobutanoate dehydrogenase subunit VorB [Deltaproteobacteria bacterium]|nr:3-methyl-2-oxobutanoate dehydrogenase subunit VorB [Deltaproteobacteria bacterium]
MTEITICTGNRAVCYGAIDAGCRHFFGYPITPQNDIPEFMSEELPRLGGIYKQTESEVSSMNMVYGAVAAGVRAMTSTSSPGFSLMQEAISGIAAAELPAVLVDVQRGGPGLGTTQTAQMDYFQATKGGGHGGYRQIVLAPHSVQETYNLLQTAFHLADTYRIMALVLMDAILGQMVEPLNREPLDLGPVPEKDWALRGKAQKGGRRDVFSTMLLKPGFYLPYMERVREKYEKIEQNEIRYDSLYCDDADMLLVSYGSTARISLEAVARARREGLKWGLFRPITLWPFPQAELRKAAEGCKAVVVVEDSMGQMIEDVRLAVRDRLPVHLVGTLSRHNPGSGGMIFPERVYEEVNQWL